MNSTPIPLNSFLEEGAFIGNLCDFIDSNTMIQIESKIKYIRSYVESDRESVLTCRYNYAPESKIYENQIRLKEVPARDLYVEKNNLVVTQKWYEFFVDIEHNKYFFNLSKKIVKTFYPNIEIEEGDRLGNFTLYEDGHFISSHRDGYNNNRLCALIMYLSNVVDYNNGGGELIITVNSGAQHVVRPLLGTFSLIDFSKNDLIHEVKAVKNGFKRYAFIHFFKVKNIKNKTII
jgi:hypothetical protein